MALDVIGTGFGRTGTDSMREALNVLGFGPCHHMREVSRHETQATHWRAVMDGGDRDWDAIFEGYRSCVDWPSAYFWEELVTHFPEAKVLLTWRSAESWWNSMAKTIIARTLAAAKEEPGVGTKIVKGTFGENYADRDHAIRIYEANVARVKATVPAERLLVYEVGSGWEPLCAHLGVAVPGVPFPRRNSAAEFNSEKKGDTDTGAT